MFSIKSVCFTVPHESHNTIETFESLTSYFTKKMNFFFCNFLCKPMYNLIFLCNLSHVYSAKILLRWRQSSFYPGFWEGGERPKSIWG